MRWGVLSAGTDVIVVCGGLLGARCAYWLARRGRQVHLFGISASPWGATGRNVDFILSVTARSYPDAVRAYGADVARGVRQLTIDGTGCSRGSWRPRASQVPSRARGSIWPAMKENQVIEGKAEVDPCQADGFDTS